MKRFWAAGAVIAAFLVAASCNDYGNTFQVPTGATITSLSPAVISAGSASFTIVVVPAAGSAFVQNTVVQWNGANLSCVSPCVPPTLDSSNNVVGNLEATVPASLVAKPGTAFVNTIQPHSGAGTNGLSNVLPFIINPPPNPIPVVSSISPASAPATCGGFTLTISGSSFLPTSDPSGGSQVHWNAGATQTTLTASSITSTQIQATVPAALIAAPGSAVVSVYNPPSSQSTPTGQAPNPPSGGGGTSANSPTFTIAQAGGTCPALSAATSAARVTEETPAVSADGRYVAYSATPSDHSQVFVHDTCEGAPSGCQLRTLLISAAADSTEGNDDSRSPSMSADGRYIAFSSAATNLVADAPGGRQVYVHDTCFGAANGSCTPSTQLISTDPNGALVGTESVLPSISASGRFVAFVAVTPSHAANPASSQPKAAVGSTNSGFRQVFVRDTCLGASNCTTKTTRISLNPSDNSAGAAPDAKPAGPAVSGAGSHVAVPDAPTATLFTHGVAVDDRVFLALTHP